MEDLLSVTQAAQQLGISKSAVNQALHDKRLAGRQLGKVWVIRAADVAAYVVAQGGPGKPRPSRQSANVSEEKREQRRAKLAEQRKNTS
jgi:excisionase family DNA binding protein